MIEVLEALGVHVVEVPGLRSVVAWVPDQEVGLLRAELEEGERSRALGWLVSAACQSSAD